LASLALNAGSDHAIVTIVSPFRQKLDLLILNIQGKTIDKQHIEIRKGDTDVELFLGRLNPGIYLLTGIGPNGKTNSLRFMRW
jgi:hypothetical protein